MYDSSKFFLQEGLVPAMSDEVTTDVPADRPDMSRFNVAARRELDLTVVRFEDADRHSFLHGNGIFSAPKGHIPEDVDDEDLYFGVVLRAVRRLSDTEWQVKAVLLEEGRTVAAVLEDFDRSVAAGLADSVGNDIIDINDVSDHG